MRDRIAAVRPTTDRDGGHHASPFENSRVCAVRATVPKTVNCGKAMPIEPQKMPVHAPPAQTTIEQRRGLAR